MWIKSNTNKFHKLLYRYIVGTAGCQCQYCDNWNSVSIGTIFFRWERLLGLKHTRLYRLLLKVWIVRMDLKSYLRSALFNKIHLHETEAFPKIFNYNIFRFFFNILSMRGKDFCVSLLTVAFNGLRSEALNCFCNQQML